MNIDYQELEKAFQEIAKGLSTIFNAISEAWNCVKSVFENKDEWLERYFKRQQQIQEMRASWHIIRDSSKSSQVLMNKPKNLIRKVIQ